MKLIGGTDSTWSLRAWICSQLSRVGCDVEVINLAAPGHKERILEHSPTGLVPALVTGTVVVHDSLAIAEYLNERSNGSLLPSSESERALSRSLCSELHSGFLNLRARFPFTLDKVSPVSDFSVEEQQELSRLGSIFEQARLPYMFDSAGMVDAFYAILAYRLQTYGVSLPGKAGDYQQSLLDWPLLQQAVSAARAWKGV